MLVQFQIAKETEKAINAKLVYQLNDNSTRQMWTAWVPKSQVKTIETKNCGDVIAELPEWLAAKIGNEICGYFNYRSLRPADMLNIEII